MTAQINEKSKKIDLNQFFNETIKTIKQNTKEYQPEISVTEIGRVHAISGGIATVTGLAYVKSEELLRFQNDLSGMAYNLDQDELGVVLLDSSANLKSGSRVYRTGRVLDVPVGKALIGRVVNALGQPLDDLGPIRTHQRAAVEQPAPDITERSSVTRPLQTGIKVIDALVPIGRGQRELILGDRQTGKTAIAMDTILNQKDKGVICIYCSIGQREANVAAYIEKLRQEGALDYTCVVVASGSETPGRQFIAPYAATAIAEYFRNYGDDVLIVYDDLTRHARAYRELSLLLRRPPGREAYPGDIFYIHSRLLERSTQLNKRKGGGSLTALPIIETQAQNISAFIPTNLVSITDGQIYLSPDLFQKGVLPAVDVGKSVSRVGGKAQLPAFRKAAGDLRLSYAQFEELEVFSRFGTRLEEKTRQQLEHGRRVREILKQPQYQTLSAAEQMIVLFAVTEGLMEQFKYQQIAKAEKYLQEQFGKELPDLYHQIQTGQALEEEAYQKLLGFIEEQLDAFSQDIQNANH